MKDFVQVGVIGLGKFGFEFGAIIAGFGVNVLGIDSNPELVKRAKNVFTQVLEADATSKEALIQMGVGQLSHVLVSVGDSLAASVMIAMYLKELGVPVVWAKAINTDHATLLKKIGVNEVIIPEHMAARQMAAKITIPGFLDYFPFSKDVVLKEIVIDQWAGQSMKDLDLTNRFGIQVIAAKHKGDVEFSILPKADKPLREGDTLVIIGAIERLEGIEP